MKNEMLTKEEIQQFKTLFSKYCRGEVNANRCDVGACGVCLINNAYDVIFGSLEPDEDFEDEENT